MSEIELNLTSGQVSVIYFVLLEFFAIAFVDVILIHVVSSLWYRRIVRGVALEVKTAEIPGVANSLVGLYSAPLNVMAYVVKIAVLGIILFADVNIKSFVRDVVVDPEKRRLIGTFVFNASFEAWGKNDSRDKGVNRPGADIQGCYALNAKAETIQFYRIRFNLTDNVVVDSEFGQEGIVVVNDSSIVCMRKGEATNYEENKLELVNGCSRHRTTRCSNETVIQFSHDLAGATPQEQFLSYYDFASRQSITYVTRDYTSEAANIFDFYNGGNYSNPTLLCMSSTFSIDNRRLQSTFDECMITAVAKRKDGDGTLIERWEYDSSTGVFSRRFPGPVFDRRVDFGNAYQAIILQQIVGLGQLSWESFSALLIGRGAIYEKDIEDVTKVFGADTVTVLPVAPVALAAVLFLSTIIGGIVVYFTVAKDTNPKINTIDGLSSIAREEAEPTGRSSSSGRAMTVGLSKRNLDEAHFGPLRSNDVQVKYRDVRSVI